MALRSALSSLIALGLEGPHLSRLVAHCSGVRALLSICLESRSSSIRTAALRALATVCCVVEAIRQLEQVPLCNAVRYWNSKTSEGTNISWGGGNFLECKMQFLEVLMSLFVGLNWTELKSCPKVWCWYFLSGCRVFKNRKRYSLNTCWRWFQG
jgi:hypothetical protein